MLRSSQLSQSVHLSKHHHEIQFRESRRNIHRIDVISYMTADSIHFTLVVVLDHHGLHADRIEV